MKVAFLHPSQGFGQQIRVNAFQIFFEQNKMDVIDCPTQEIFSHGILDKILRLPFRFHAGKQFSSYCKAAEKIANALIPKASTCDYIHAENHEGALIGSFLKEKVKKPLVFDMHGLAVEEALGRNERPREIAFARALEKYVVDSADRILVVSEIMGEYLSAEYKFSQDKVEIIPCGSSVYKSKAKFSEICNVVYAGGCGYYEKVLDYLEMPKVFFKNYPEYTSRVKFHHIGKLPKNFNPGNFEGKVWGIKSRDETMQTLSTMQIGVAPSTNDLNRKCASPVKIADYASCGLPIICPDIGEWSENIRTFNAGIVCKESNPIEFSQALSQLIDRETWTEKSTAALKMIRERYEWNLVLKPLFKVYNLKNHSYEQSANI
jgi:glycosyltransferase involved in cell wall biosynthesis